MKSITIEVPGPPVAQARTRSTKTGHHYTPKRSADYRNLIALAARQVWKDKPLDCLCGIEVEVATLAPKTMPAKLRKEFNASGFLPSGKRPDCDNYLKQACDAMNGIIVKDDSQFWKARCCKFISEIPGITITITYEEQHDNR